MLRHENQTKFLIIAVTHTNLYTVLYTLELFKKAFLLKSDAANGFSRCITPKNHIDQFSRKIWMFKGVHKHNSILVYDVIKKSGKINFRKHWQVTYQQMQNDPQSRSLLIVLVYQH